MLGLGLNFALAPTKLSLVDTMSAVEKGARQLKDDDTDDLRGGVCGILRRAKVPEDYLMREQSRVLKQRTKEMPL